MVVCGHGLMCVETNLSVKTPNAIRRNQDYRRDEDSTSASSGADEGSEMRKGMNENSTTKKAKKAKKAPLWAPKRKNLVAEDEEQLAASLKVLSPIKQSMQYNPKVIDGIALNS